MARLTRAGQMHLPWPHKDDHYDPARVRASQIRKYGMRLRHIEIFHAVYANGSITAAAHILHVSQPSVSKALMHAESQIGFPLFKRTAGRLIPTEEAHVLFEEVRPIFERLETLRLVANNLRTGPDRAGISGWPSCRRLRSMLPRLRFQIFESRIPVSASRSRCCIMMKSIALC